MKGPMFQKELTSNKSKECVVCHYWYFKDIGHKC